MYCCELKSQIPRLNIWGLAFAFIFIPLFCVTIKRQSIESVDVIGNFYANEFYECYFSDNSFAFISGNSDFLTPIEDIELIQFKKPENIKESHCFRLDLGERYVDSLHIDSINVRYSNGYIKHNTAKSYFKRVNYLSPSIQSIKYTSKNGVSIFFQNSSIYDPYVEFNIENRYYSWNYFIIIIGILFLLCFLLNYLDIGFKDLSVFFISTVGFLSFFSSILANNLFVIFICLLSIYEFFKTKNKERLNIINICFLALFAIKIVWTFIPHLSNTTGVISEKYMTYLFVPIALSCLRLNKNTSITILKAIITVCAILIYINVLSYIIYFSSSNINSSYLDSMFFHYPEFTHSSYVAYFYTTGLISSFLLYREKFISKLYIFIYFVGILFFCINTEARIGIPMSILVLVIGIINTKNNFILGIVGALIGIFVMVFPFTDLIENIDPVRGATWSIAKGNIKENIPYGVGTGNDSKVFSIENLNKYTFDTSQIPLNNSHNQLLNDMIEHGVFFGSFMYIFLLILLINSHQKGNTYLFQFVIITLLFMTTEVITDRSRGLIFFVMIICFYFKFDNISPISSQYLIKYKE